MGTRTSGIYSDQDGTWQVDKWKFNRRFRRRGFPNFDEAEAWLIKQLGEAREVVLHGERVKRTFNEAATYYLALAEKKASIETEISLLKGLMPYIGHLRIEQIHDGTLAEFVAVRLSEGRKHKTINLALAVVRHILNLASKNWRDENGKKWIESAPKITLLPLSGFQREPRPITWAEQIELLSRLPDHLSRMALFSLNSGCRDNVVCSLRWSWEIRIPELSASVFEVPIRHVKGRTSSRVVVCNSVAQAVIESMRGRHEEFVFVYRRERVKPGAQPPKMAYHPIGTMNNTAWQNARAAAQLGDLHVHDLRHTVGMRLREMGVHESTVADILWHKTRTMTQHYSMGQLVELHDSLEKIKQDSGRWNKSLATLRREQQALREMTDPPKVPQKK